MSLSAETSDPLRKNCREETLMNKTDPATVLVVDNDPSVLCIVEKILAANDFRPILASSGEEALDIVSRKPGIDLVLTDLDMPGINGLVLAKLFCNLYPKIRIVFMSGCILPTTLFSILGKKVPFLEKPFRINSLIDKIRYILN